MQDKFQNQKSIDQGWKAMKKLLDQEMPVVKKERKFLWYLWLPAIIVLLGGLSWLILSRENPGEKTDKEEPQHIPMAHQEQTDQKIDLETMAETERVAITDEADMDEISYQLDQQSSESLSNITSESTTKELMGNTSSYTKPEAIIDKNRDAQTTLAIAQKENEEQGFHAIENSKGADQLIEIAISLEEKNVNTNVPVHKIETESVVLPFQSDLAQASQAIDFLNRKIDPVFSLSNHNAILDLNFAYDPVIFPVQSSDKKVGISAGVRAGFNSSLGLQGIGIGPEVRLKLSRSLNLFAGILYENQNKNGLFRGGTTEDALTNTQGGATTVFSSNAGDNMAALSENASYNDIESLSNSFHYLHLPIGVEFFLGKVFSLHGGFRFSRLLSAPSKYKIAVVDEESLNLSFDRLDGFSRNALFTNDFVSKNDVSAILGGSLYLGKKWAVTAEYNHGLMPLISTDKNDGSNSFNRIFSVGLRYHFSRSQP